jgi:hypothetical protein
MGSHRGSSSVKQASINNKKAKPCKYVNPKLKDLLNISVMNTRKSKAKFRRCFLTKKSPENLLLSDSVAN